MQEYRGLSSSTGSTPGRTQEIAAPAADGASARGSRDIGNTHVSLNTTQNVRAVKR